MRINTWIGFTKTLKTWKEFNRWHKKIIKTDGTHIRVGK